MQLPAHRDDTHVHTASPFVFLENCVRVSAAREKYLLGPFRQIMGAVRALPSKFSRRSGPCQIMALREQPVKFYGLPGPLLTPPNEPYTHATSRGPYNR